jgi:hypothetical protein
MDIETNANAVTASYNTRHQCCYLESPDSGEQYQIDFLAVFGFTDAYADFLSNESAINKETERVYELIRRYEPFKECLKCAGLIMFCTDPENDIGGLMALFSYDYLYLAHPCISEFLETGKISENKIAELLQKLR